MRLRARLLWVALIFAQLMLGLLNWLVTRRGKCLLGSGSMQVIATASVVRLFQNENRGNPRGMEVMAFLSACQAA